ncbi:uncharacterized protein DCS_04906 [Drechmeria coniospora]|uniref:Cortical patch protein n=1 Tax=Drechmeria coniospora TaxID=98403 RepID=A0A151GLA6_DRECN|nr:uncharacterized protein DCS_04906 [Drechmeria coniospora]KYK57893.1 uncharacterized protein DCS_04906 [Drechmeria coniospora]ODA83265.1 hypothetical protein RJ55_01777 [Drechmeria coniospora]
MPKNAPLGLAALLVLAASIVMLFFIILSGVTSATPLNKTYFLQADTSGITGAKDISQWTYFYVCGPGNTDCTDARAAPPFGFAWDSNAQNVPPALYGGYGSGTTSYQYYYLWRFGWVFLLLTLFFEVLTFFAGFLACCGRLGAAISFVIASVALLCYTIAASLTTATFVLARDEFHDAGRDAQIGSYAFGFLWGSYVALIVTEILFLLGIRSDKSSSSPSAGNRSSRVKEDYA